MQIQYCDDCGTRVDDSEIVSIGGKLYCRQCAKSHAPPDRPGTAMFTGPRTSSRTARLARATGSRAPVVENAFNPPFGTAAPGDDSDLGYADSSSAFTNWARRNRALVISLGAGVAGVLIVVLWSAISGPSKKIPAATPKDTPLATSQTVVAPTDNKAPPVNKDPIAHIPDPPPVEPKFDARLDKAQRDLKAIKELIAGGAANPYDLRKRLEDLVAPHWIKKTEIGLEGEKLLAQYKNEKRPPDKSVDAAPGLQAKIGYDKAAELFNTSFKAAETKTLAEINFPNAAAIKTALGRDLEVAAKITGFVEVPKDGEYTFYISSDDGSLFYVGDQRLVENVGTHQLTERDGTIDLKAGKHAIRLEYFQAAGAAGLIFSWSGPGLIKQVVPASALSSIPKK